MANAATQIALKVADEVWIAAALLHRDHPEAADFAIEEIVRRAEREGLHKPLRRGVYVHVIQHCVANRAPNPGRYRMLFETGAGARLRSKMLDRGDQLLTSTLTLGEILVKPTERSDSELCRKYEHAISSAATLIAFDVKAAKVY